MKRRTIEELMLANDLCFGEQIDALWENFPLLQELVPSKEWLKRDLRIRFNNNIIVWIFAIHNRADLAKYGDTFDGMIDQLLGRGRRNVKKTS